MDSSSSLQKIPIRCCRASAQQCDSYDPSEAWPYRQRSPSHPGFNSWESPFCLAVHSAAAAADAVVVWSHVMPLLYGHIKLSISVNTKNGTPPLPQKKEHPNNLMLKEAFCDFISNWRLATSFDKRPPNPLPLAQYRWPRSRRWANVTRSPPGPEKSAVKSHHFHTHRLNISRNARVFGRFFETFWDRLKSDISDDI